MKTLAAAVVAALLSTPAFAQWKVERKKDAMTDKVTVTAIRHATKTISAWPGKTARPALVLRCHRDEIEVYLFTGATLQPTGLDEARVQMRIDDGDAITATWSEATSSDAYFAPWPAEVLAKLAQARRVRFEVIPFNSNPQLVEVDLSGSAKPIEEIRAACK